MKPSFDAELIERYGGEGPRYTSYPTAVHFNERFSAGDLYSAIDESNRLPIPPDLSVYVHVPFCSNPCFYCACNRVITRSPSAGDDFLSTLDSEVGLLAPRFDRDRQVRQVHLGGGTPTFLSLDQIERLMSSLRTRFFFSEQAEIGLEVDPRTISPDGIGRLREIGFNRISIGVQDLNEQVQQAVNRVHDTETVRATLDAARSADFDSISVDLIYGLPQQTTSSFAATMESIMSMQPDRLSLFNYAHLPHLFKGQRRIRSEQLPSPASKLAIFRNTLKRLLDAGYEFIGMDHFALPGDALVKSRAEGSLVRNFQGYATHGGLDLISFGPSAISQIGDSFAQNHRQLEDWRACIDRAQAATARGLTRTTDDRLRAEVIDRIMCTGKLVYRELERLFEVHFLSYFEAEMQRLEALVGDGLLRWTSGGFEVTARGLLFLRAIARVFDAYLLPTGQQQGRFSRIV